MTGVTHERDDKWFAAIGRVVVAGASLESAAGALLFAITHGTPERFYPWPISKLLDEIPRQVHLVSDADLRQRVDGLVGRTKSLMSERNDVVHGWWRFGTDGQDALVGRASIKTPDLRVLHMTQADLDGLTSKLVAAASRVMVLSQSVIADRLSVDP